RRCGRRAAFGEAQVKAPIARGSRLSARPSGARTSDPVSATVFFVTAAARSSCGRISSTSSSTPAGSCWRSRSTIDDYSAVKALAEEVGAKFTVDRTVTPMMDGDRSILDLNIGEEALRRNPL